MLRANGSITAGSATNVVTIAGLRELWAETLGDPRICVAVLDGPVDQSHPSLAAANLTQLETLVSGSTGRGPACQHGTHIASVIFGQHDGPVKGIAPRCCGLIVPVFRDAADGSIAPCSQLDLARAITQAAQAGAHILSISGGELSPSGTAHPLLADAVRNCVTNNVLIVAAAGNEGCECLHIPGALPSVLAVGAMNAQGLPLEVSNWGEKYRSQGVLAPGESILGASPGGGAVTNSGTSYATPIVSGIAALLLSLQLTHGQKPNPKAVREAILSSAVGCEDDPVPDCRRLLAGRLNIKGAMSQVMKGGGSMSDAKERQEGIPLHGQEDDGSKTPTDETSATTIGPVRFSSSPSEGSEDPTRLQKASPTISQEHVNSMTRGAVVPTRVHASICSCLEGGPCSCGATTSVQLVFALGTLGYDFGTEARRDSILQHMAAPANPYDPSQLLAYLERNPWDAAAILWTLNLDATPIYAIQARGAFASDIYKRLRDFLGEQTRGEVERVSIPGYIAGSARLFTGQVVPVIWPEPRGIYSWNTTALVEAVCGTPPPAQASQREKDEYAQKVQAVANFLRRVYDELRNLGVTSQERAINYAATNAFQIGEVFRDAIREEMDLDTIEVERSPICRPSSDCWDVKLTFFNPRRVFEQARKVYRFTVDVSDVVPVMVGPVRSWFVR
jgi:cyanobactin maturation PatA/PatG family protease